MSALDKIFELWFANSGVKQTREHARSTFDSMFEANARVKELVARSNPNSVRAVNLTKESRA
jgi:hypothetical protein